MLVLGLPIFFLYPKSAKTQENFSVTRPLQDQNIDLNTDLPLIPNPSEYEPVAPTFTPTPLPTLTPKPKPTVSPRPTIVTQTISNVDYYTEITKQNGIGRYVPTGLVELPKPISKRTSSASSVIVEDLTKLIEAAKNDGIDLKVVSGYRSYSDQENIFNDYVKNEMYRHPGMSREDAEILVNTYSARPGHSEHQLGTTVDVLSLESNYSFNINTNMKFVKWLEENSTKYNFRISYTKGNGEYNYEPWHLRWMPR
jgi:D-alanyl-D-alanine carboxypeptidase